MTYRHLKPTRKNHYRIRLKSMSASSVMKNTDTIDETIANDIFRDFDGKENAAELLGIPLETMNLSLKNYLDENRDSLIRNYRALCDTENDRNSLSYVARTIDDILEHEARYKQHKIAF